MKIQRTTKTLIFKLLLLIPFIAPVAVHSQKSMVKYVEHFDNINHPQLLYWMWDDYTITNKQYLKDIDKMASQSPFDLVFISSRFTDSIGFWNTQKMKPFFSEAVAYAHQKGIKIGLQLWPMNRTRELFLNNFPIKEQDAEALIVGKECQLDEKGKASVENKSEAARFNKITSAKLVRVWLFKKTTDGFYNPNSLVVSDTNWLTVKQHRDFSFTVSIHAPEKFAGYTAFVTTAHYYNYFDVFSKKHSEVFTKMLDAYSGIPFDGTALDENGAMGIKTKWNQGEILSELPWSNDFATYYRHKYPADPVRLLLDMRYAPENKPEIRINAINTYFESRAKGTTLVEHSFRDYSKKLFGQHCFSGCHSTFHNMLTGDDIWTTGLNWWDLPREYGQTDEGQPMPDRMGIGISGTKPVMYNMYYSKDKNAMYREAIDPAPFGVREHYHGWNDSQGWGKNLQDDDFLIGLKPVEERVRLLNHFNPAPPRLPLLIVYNFPYQLNWFPDKEQINSMGIRNCTMQATASAIWDAGYPCASIPSTWLDRKLVSVEKDGKVRIKDRIFDAVIFLTQVAHIKLNES